jgi:predicted O-linked N-acetylglucosamine transferase (SPINDLY family)
MDYIIADAFLIPENQRQYYSEQIIYLPDCFQVNDDQRIINPAPDRQAAGLPEQGFIFCSFNNSYKITPEFFAIWMRLLKQVQTSVLWLVGNNPEVCQNLRREAEQRGVNPQRLIFTERVPYPQHLARFQLADLFLDTPHYNAHATCADALWAGVPVLTQVGSTFAGRVAASQLHALGMADCIVDSVEAYTEKAIELALNPALLQSVRDRLAQNSKTMPLFDSKLYVKNLENTYRTIISQHAI